MTELQEFLDWILTLGPTALMALALLGSYLGKFKWPRESEYYTKREYDAVVTDKKKVEQYAR